MTINVPEKKSTFCVLPWIHLHVGTQGLQSLCCDANEFVQNFGPINKNNPIDVFNSEAYLNIKQKMLAGEKVTTCERCYLNEASGLQSSRQFYNKTFKTEHDEILSNRRLTTTDLVSIDFRGDNTCNFRCRSCNPFYSSTLAAEGLFLEEFNFKKIENKISIKEIYDQLSFKKVKRIYFAGGEPLLAKDHIWFLKKLIQDGLQNIELVYTTNGSCFYRNNFEIIECWKLFKKIVVGVSIDSWAERADYIRKGGVWSEIEMGLKYLNSNLKNAYIFASCTVSVFNVLTLTELHTYLTKNNLISKNNFHFHMVYDPEIYCISYLGEELRSAAIVEILKLQSLFSNQKIISDLNGIIQFLKTPTAKNLIPEFIKKTNYIDEKRNERFKDFFSELIPFFKGLE